MIRISSTDDIQVLSQGFEQFSGASFDPNTSYFTKDSDGFYHVTTETAPQQGVQYYTLGLSRERVKIGCLNVANDLYGIRISNSDGHVVMQTGSDGSLWLENMLKVGDPTRECTTYIGYNPDTTKTRKSTYQEFRETQDRT